ncbi:hypothetical protein N7414_05445 [Pseudomonas sp. GD04087]|uniref:hypothetical protein n=2 Tax=Pseudomonas TaxID=286 RepID=UPI00244CEDC8|nr:MULTISPECIES: hypothetical protein [unclassified Pseudomonas]MDH0288551.1 hypothetical protein [Pseudomonas sp. GD04087]MDH1051649.1 hypothetical protein [Pseudomonas sp. GD03903]
MSGFIAFLCMTLFSLLCQAEEISMGFIEGVEKGGEGKVYIHTDKRISRGSAVEYQYSIEDETKCCGVLKGKDLKFIGTSQSLYKDGGSHGLVYQVDAKKIDYRKVDGFVGFLVVNAPGTTEDSPTVLRAPTPSGEVVIESCYGTEGINLYRKQADKVEGHLYFYLNYDIEADCP